MAGEEQQEGGKEVWHANTVERALKRWLVVRLQGYRWYITITQAQRDEGMETKCQWCH
jgi:hypothetical protein